MKQTLSPLLKNLKEELQLPSLFQAGKRVTQRDKELPSSLKDHFQLSSLLTEAK